MAFVIQDSYLNHLLLASLAGSAQRDVVARHADDALDAVLAGEDGDLVEHEVADFDTAAEAGGHVGGNPVAVDGEGGQHGRPLGGGDLEEVREGEVGEAGDFEGGDGEADGVADEVGDHFGDVRAMVVRDGDVEGSLFCRWEEVRMRRDGEYEGRVAVMSV